MEKLSKKEISLYKSKFLKKCIVTVKEDGYPAVNEVVRFREDMQKLNYLKLPVSVINEIIDYVDRPLDLSRKETVLRYLAIRIDLTDNGLVSSTNVSILKENIHSYQAVSYTHLTLPTKA